jgi:hypothetical protein
MSLWKRTTLATLTAAFAVAAMPASAITNDWVPDYVHPYVGLAVFYDADGVFLWRCSGTLISKKKFLTAGHCADTAEGAASARIWFQQDAGAHYDPTLQYDPVSGYPEDCAGADSAPPYCVTSHSIHNYGFDNFASFPNTHDVGVLILDQAVTAFGFGALPGPGTLDGLAAARGTKDTVFTVSGYGLTFRTEEHSAVPNISYRSRLMAQSSLTNLGSSLTDGFNLQTQGNGNDRGGTCSGDSGGPVFLGGTSSNLIVAVTSFGLNELCRGTDFSYRVDRSEVLDWIDSIRR